MRKIALATSENYSDLTKDERLVLNKLLYWGVDVEPIVWNAENVIWNQFDAVFIRSCWDYHLKLDEFFKWIEQLEKESVAVFNTPEILRWNSRKTYLKDIAEKEISVVPTVWVSRQEEPNLNQIVTQKQWKRAVVKPVVSANAYETWLTTTDKPQEDQTRLEKMLMQHGEVMIQKYISDITTRGEWSFIFFDNRYSHCVWKKPKDGDFRVQDTFGGTATGKKPPRHLLEQAQNIVNTVALGCLYARVDAVEVEKNLVLMELELIEPSLFLEKHAKAPRKFAEAIVTRMNALHTQEHSLKV